MVITKSLENETFTFYTIVLYYLWHKPTYNGNVTQRSFVSTGEAYYFTRLAQNMSLNNV